MSDKLESELSLNYHLGIWSATDGFAKELEEKSGKAYAARKDDEAKFFRSLADEYKEKARKLRLEYDTNRKAHEAEHGRN